MQCATFADLFRGFHSVSLAAVTSSVFQALSDLAESDFRQIWPDTVVEEVNLAHNISVLRKALGQRLEWNRFIITVPGRGYGFVAEVRETHRNTATSAVLAE